MTPAALNSWRVRKRGRFVLHSPSIVVASNLTHGLQSSLCTEMPIEHRVDTHTPLLQQVAFLPVVCGFDRDLNVHLDEPRTVERCSVFELLTLREERERKKE